jgi:hypothetical protein
MAAVIKLTPEDKAQFKAAMRSASPVEVLAMAAFIDGCPRFSAADMQFMRSCIGKRCERLLRNVVKNHSFDD